MKVLPISRQDFRQAVQLLSRAFVNDPVSIAVYRNFSPSRRINALEVDFSAELQLCLRRGSPLQVSEAGRMVAAAIIYPPGGFPFPLTDQWMLLVKSILGNGWYNLGAWIKWLGETDHLHPKVSHYYLEYIGVIPDEQGKGYGTCVLEYLASQADERGVGCYLENANPRNVPFYKQCGYQIMAEKQVIGLPAWFMWRPPSRQFDSPKLTI
jgi:GNAT superfamily N-acetyltransferase